MNLYLSFGEFCSSRVIIQSFLPAQHVAVLFHTCPRLCHHHLCAVFGIFFHRTSPLVHVLQEVENCIRFFVAQPSHGAPHAFRNFSHKKKGNIICPNIFVAIMLVLVWYSTHVSSNIFVNIFCCQSLFFSQCLLCPRPSFTSKREDGIHILALVHLDVLPVWELWCAGFRHSACLHDRVIF